MAFKDNLRRLRIQKGFSSRRNFAMNVLGIEYTTYNNYEVKDTIPPENLIIKIAKVLDVSIDELFGYDSKTKETDIDIVVRELNDLGIKSKINKTKQEVDIYLNSHEKFVSIPFEEMINIVKYSKDSSLLFKTINHVLYSLIINKIIHYKGEK